MTETVAAYHVVKSDVGISMTGPFEWRNNALSFKRQLSHTETEKFVKGLTEFATGHQLMFCDLWHEVDRSGGDWTQYAPGWIAKNTAMNWFRVGDRFPVDYRRKKDNLDVSHYIEANHKELSNDQAIQLMDHADAHEWTVQMVREAVREAIGKPVKIEKPKLITCAHCDQWIADIEDEVCPYCALDVATKEFREILQEIRDCDIDDPGEALRFVVDVAVKALEI